MNSSVSIMGPDVYIRDLITDDEGTISRLEIPALKWSCYINELPERGNERNFSRIPRPATYHARWVVSKKHGGVYLIDRVPDRSAILMHSGNYAGDVKKNYRSDVLGCMEYGYKVAKMHGQRVVVNSRSTRDTFEKLMNGDDFKLIIL